MNAFDRHAGCWTALLICSLCLKFVHRWTSIGAAFAGIWCIAFKSNSCVDIPSICSVSCWNTSFWLFLVWSLKSIRFVCNPGTWTVNLLGAWFGFTKGRLLRCVRWFPRLFQNCWYLIRRSDDAEKWMFWSSSKAQSSVTFDTVLKACAICEDTEELHVHWQVTFVADVIA